MTCINACSFPPDAWRSYLLHDFLRRCEQTLVTSDRTPTIDRKKQYHSGLSRNSELGVTHRSADDLYSRVIEKPILAMGDGSWQLRFWSYTPNLEEAHKDVYCLYNHAEELWSLLSSLWALWVLHSSSFCISIQGKQMQNTVLLGGCVPLDGQQTPTHLCFFSKLTAFRVPFWPRPATASVLLPIFSLPFFFKSKDLITISTRAYLVLCVESFRLKTGQENYSVDTVNTCGLDGFLILLQPPESPNLRRVTPDLQATLLKAWKIRETLLKYTQRLSWSQTVNLSLRSGRVLHPSRSQPETRRNNSRGNFLLSLDSRFSGDGGKEAEVSRLCEPCFGGGGGG